MQTRFLATTTATAVIVATVLTGCAVSVAQPSATQAAAPTVTPAAPSNEVLAEYFAALANQDPVELRRVADEITAPGSNAYAYALHQAGISQAIQDGGYQKYSQEIRTIDGGFSLCETSVSSGAPCAEFTQLTYTAGKLSDFYAGGQTLTGRISLGDGTATPLSDAGTVTLISAYRSITGAMMVVADVRSNVDGLTISNSSSYTAPDGRQADATNVTGPTELGPGALGTYSFAFDGAQFGGTLNVSAYTANFLDSISAQIPTS